MVTHSFQVRTLLKPLLFILFCLSNSPLFAQTVTYTYDALGRVTYVNDSANGNRDYDYDAAGNRLLVSSGTANDPAAEPLPPGSLPAPVIVSCNQYPGPTWAGVWQPVANAHHYIYTNASGTQITVTAPSTGTSSNALCKSVKACDASNNCGAQANF